MPETKISSNLSNIINPIITNKKNIINSNDKKNFHKIKLSHSFTDKDKNINHQSNNKYSRLTKKSNSFNNKKTNFHQQQQQNQEDISTKLNSSFRYISPSSYHKELNSDHPGVAAACGSISLEKFQVTSDQLLTYSPITPIGDISDSLSNISIDNNNNNKNSEKINNSKVIYKSVMIIDLNNNNNNSNMAPPQPQPNHQEIIVTGHNGKNEIKKNFNNIYILSTPKPFIKKCDKKNVSSIKKLSFQTPLEIINTNGNRNSEIIKSKIEMFSQNIKTSNIDMSLTSHKRAIKVRFNEDNKEIDRSETKETKSTRFYSNEERRRNGSYTLSSKGQNNEKILSVKKFNKQKDEYDSVNSTVSINDYNQFTLASNSKVMSSMDESNSSSSSSSGLVDTIDNLYQPYENDNMDSSLSSNQNTLEKKQNKMFEVNSIANSLNFSGRNSVLACSSEDIDKMNSSTNSEHDTCDNLIDNSDLSESDNGIIDNKDIDDISKINSNNQNEDEITKIEDKISKIDEIDDNPSAELFARADDDFEEFQNQIKSSDDEFTYSYGVDHFLMNNTHRKINSTTTTTINCNISINSNIINIPMTAMTNISINENENQKSEFNFEIFNLNLHRLPGYFFSSI
jgi:hypothetical protein